MTRFRATRVAVALFATQLTAACHAYRPAAFGELDPGDDVRALLTPEQFLELSETLAGPDRRVEGTVVESDSTSLLLEAPLVTVVQGIRVRSHRQRFRLPATGVADVELRELASGRTAALAGAAGAVIAAILWRQLGDARVGDGPGPPQPQEAVPAGVRIPFAAPWSVLRSISWGRR